MFKQNDHFSKYQKESVPRARGPKFNGLNIDEESNADEAAAAALSSEEEVAPKHKQQKKATSAAAGKAVPPMVDLQAFVSYSES